jgi:hypothetical protein
MNELFRQVLGKALLNHKQYIHESDSNYIIFRSKLNFILCTMLGFTNRGVIQTSISVPVKGFLSNFGSELL